MRLPEQCRLIRPPPPPRFQRGTGAALCARLRISPVSVWDSFIAEMYLSSWLAAARHKDGMTGVNYPLLAFTPASERRACWGPDSLREIRSRDSASHRLQRRRAQPRADHPGCTGRASPSLCCRESRYAGPRQSPGRVSSSVDAPGRRARGRCRPHRAGYCSGQRQSPAHPATIAEAGDSVAALVVCELQRRVAPLPAAHRCRSVCVLEMSAPTCN